MSVVPYIVFAYPSLVLKKGWKLKSAADKTACDFLYVDCI